jgi:hypothetical protein
LGLGVLVGLLMELFARRVRGIEDLKSIVEVPVLAVIPAIDPNVLWWLPLPKLGKSRRFRGRPKPGPVADGPSVPGAVAA